MKMRLKTKNFLFVSFSRSQTAKKCVLVTQLVQFIVASVIDNYLKHRKKTILILRPEFVGRVNQR